MNDLNDQHDDRMLQELDELGRIVRQQRLAGRVELDASAALRRRLMRRRTMWIGVTTAAAATILVACTLLLWLTPTAPTDVVIVLSPVADDASTQPRRKLDWAAPPMPKLATTGASLQLHWSVKLKAFEMTPKRFGFHLPPVPQRSKHDEAQESNVDWCVGGGLAGAAADAGRSERVG